MAEKSRLRRSLSRWASSSADHARRASCGATYAEAGGAPIAEAPDRERVTVQGTLRTVTLRPRGGVPRSRPSCTTAPACSPWSGSAAGGSPGSRPGRVDARSRAGSASPTGTGHVQPALRADAVTRSSRPTARRPTSRPSRQVVRAQLAKALGGRRGMLEAAVPTILFTVIVAHHQGPADRPRSSASRPRWCCWPSGSCSARPCSSSSTPCSGSASAGSSCAWPPAAAASADDQALAYFLPGILYNAGYAVVLALHLPDRLAAGRLHGRQRHRRPDRLARRPADRPALHAAHLAAGRCRASLRVVVQAPIWLAGNGGADRRRRRGRALLGVLKIAHGLAAAARRAGGDGRGCWRATTRRSSDPAGRSRAGDVSRRGS